MSNLQNFRGKFKLQQAALTFISTHLINAKEQQSMRTTFEQFDANHDGRLSKEEVVAGFKSMNIPNYKEEAARIFEMVDADQNGYLEFSEWCTATMDKRAMLTKERLRQAFDIFDADGSGQISMSEVKALLDHAGKHDQKLFDDMIKEMDIDGDGVIDFKEF